MGVVMIRGITFARSLSFNHNLCIRRFLSENARKNVASVHTNALDCLENPDEYVNFSTLVDCSQQLVEFYGSESTTAAEERELFEKVHKLSKNALQLLEDNRVMNQERSSLMTMQDESRQELNSEVLSLAGCCFFGVFSIAIHPVFLFPFFLSLRSLSKQRNRETFRVEGMHRIEDINKLSIENSKEALSIIQKIIEESEKLQGCHPVKAL
eukprot:GDKJ01019836.1.p1 GENE.GDKJ01019836.1~~GDKJ01019836.1.p1  ORF type:complete len:211 (-),score=42.06 GDKJ01019836.1:76-708(-)